jgi:hypothetical protein
MRMFPSPYFMRTNMSFQTVLLHPTTQAVQKLFSLTKTNTPTSIESKQAQTQTNPDRAQVQAFRSTTTWQRLTDTQKSPALCNESSTRQSLFAAPFRILAVFRKKRVKELVKNVWWYSTIEVNPVCKYEHRLYQQSCSR